MTEASGDADPPAGLDGPHPAETFAMLFDRHARPLHRYLARRAGTQIADDLVSETFLVALNQRHVYQPERATVRAWLYGIATNLLRNHLRSEVRGLRATARAVNRSTDPPGHDATVAERVDAQVSAQRLTAGLAALKGRMSGLRGRTHRSGGSRSSRRQRRGRRRRRRDPRRHRWGRTPRRQTDRVISEPAARSCRGERRRHAGSAGRRRPVPLPPRCLSSWDAPTPSWAEGLPRDPKKLLARLRADVEENGVRGPGSIALKALVAAARALDYGPRTDGGVRAFCLSGNGSRGIGQ